MVEFTKDSIVITVKASSPFTDWLEMQRALIDANWFLLSNKEMPSNEFNFFWLVELQRQLCEIGTTRVKDDMIHEILISK